MELLLPSEPVIQDIEQSEINYMLDRMRAIQQRPSNPEGVEIASFGHGRAFYSQTMPWPAFNTVKGLRSEDIEHLDEMISFYRTRGRKVQLEIIPGLVDQSFLRELSSKGLYPSGWHTSLYRSPGYDESEANKDPIIRIEAMKKTDIETYAMIHCRGTGLPDEGIPPVAANNRVLFDRPGWQFYLAYYEDKPAAVGVMHREGGIASLTFAATLPEYRHRGLQQRLLQKRIEAAADHHCRLIVGQCAYLSTSHRNMERVGMKIGYIRTTWTEL